MKAGKLILDLLYPPKCLFCGRLLEDGEERLCGACLPLRERCRCEKSRKAEFIEAAAAPLYYEEPVRSALHRYKFGGRSAYAGSFGFWMAEAVRDQLPGDFTVLSWVPLSPRRQRQRGYDQARLLAEALGEELGMEPRPLLRKVRHVRPQSSLGGPAERRANISGCYVLRPEAEISGERILLVDDIMTTGATLSECARMLLMGGAAAVYGAAAARGRDE